jgi:hypothetical protein
LGILLLDPVMPDAPALRHSRLGSSAIPVLQLAHTSDKDGVIKSLAEAKKNSKTSIKIA